ncbi:hypothetical protein MHYP_G00359410 [Metynnis hypsauchen]
MLENDSHPMHETLAALGGSFTPSQCAVGSDGLTLWRLRSCSGGWKQREVHVAAAGPSVLTELHDQDIRMKMEGQSENKRCINETPAWSSCSAHASASLRPRRNSMSEPDLTLLRKD